MGKRKKEGLKVVLDTNVLVSGLLCTGETSKVVRLWQDRKIIPVISRETFEELRTVVQYPKFGLNRQEIRDLIEFEILPYFEVLDVVQKIQNVCRDPEDDKFIACTISAGVDYLVTGDRDLSDMKRYKNIRILTIAEFISLFDLKRLRSRTP
jgi:putative PIN family toxin of toxin-antitoxin system